MTDNNTKSIGIVGCGLIADTHVEVIKNSIPDATWPDSTYDVETVDNHCLAMKGFAQ